MLVVPAINMESSNLLHFGFLVVQLKVTLKKKKGLGTAIFFPSQGFKAFHTLAPVYLWK